MGGAHGGRKAHSCITCLILCRVEHKWEAKPVQVLSFHANADHATGVFYHEGHGLCRDLVRCDDKVALVLPVLVVDDNEELAVSETVVEGELETVGVSEGLRESGTSTILPYSPLPSWPYVSSPQQEMAPPVVSTHVCI